VGIILKPFAWLLLLFYNFGGYGLALILFAIVIKTILFPVTLKSKKSMIQMNMLSGKMQQLQKQYGKDQQRYNQEIQKLYEKEKVNPMGGCMWSLIPMVVLVALYGIIRQPITYLMNVSSADLITQISEITGVANSGSFPQIAMAKALNAPDVLAQAQAALGEAGEGLFAMDFTFLGLDLAAVPSWKFWEGGISWNSVGLFILPLVSAAVSLLSMKVSLSTNQMNTQTKNPQMDQSNKMMMWMMPLMSLWIGFTLPAALCIYWIAQYFVTMAQEIICGKLLKKDYEAARQAAAERERQEKEEEKQRKEEARLERARRIEEEKQNRGKKKSGGGKKDDETGLESVNKSDSREGLRAYARGRAYIPDRFGGVTEYRDPNEQIKAEQAARAAAAETKKKKKTTEKSQVVDEDKEV
jgi:YidC/Oxa1 family membrane protein insertase